MAGSPPTFEEQPESNDPFGMSKYSIRRYSVQHFLLLSVVLCLIVAMNVHAVLAGHVVLIALAAATMLVALAMTGLIILIGIRSVAIEIWIRRLGMGDFEYRIEPRGQDEISKTCLALETLRQNSIRAMRMDMVQRLSDELREKNDDLEQALANLRQSQDRIISQQKLAELGELSSGVAHEMRNPLHFIRNFASSSKVIASELGEILEQPEGTTGEDVEELIRDLTENMDRLMHHTGRVNGIVSAMLTLDRGTGGGFQPVDLNRLLSQQTNLAHQAVQSYEPGFVAEVTMELDPRLEEVIAVPEDVARAVANLVTNACQAMAERARLEGNEYRPELTVGTAGVEDGVLILIRDNGMGMTPEIMEKMFNPFFTTRDTGRNTGLGLSLAYDVVRGHGGNIDAESEPGQHTEMKVLLPKYQETRVGASVQYTVTPA